MSGKNSAYTETIYIYLGTKTSTSHSRQRCHDVPCTKRLRTSLVTFFPITATLLGLHKFGRWMGGTQKRSSEFGPRTQPSSMTESSWKTRGGKSGDDSLIFTLQMRIVPSYDPEMTCLLSCKNATEMTSSVCPLNGPAMMSPVSVSQTQMVLSFDPETTFCCLARSELNRLYLCVLQMGQP
jgi:hypothetical protein